MDATTLGKRDEYHIRCYQRAIRKGIDFRVLSKYSRLINSSRRSELLRHTCHVSAWVLGLSVEQACATATRRRDIRLDIEEDKGLSPIGVLIRLLQSRGSGSFPARLQSCFDRLRVRIDAVLSDPNHRNSHSLWQDLERTLPKVRKKRARLDMEDVLRANSLQRHGDGSKRWCRALKKYTLHQNGFRLHEDHGLFVEELLMHVRTAYAEADAVTMCDLFLKGAALLNRPRPLHFTETGQEMCDAAQQRLRAAFQTKVREVILLCLQGLDFSHAGTCMRADVQVASSAIKCMLEGVDLQEVKASKQWSGIKFLLDTIASRSIDGNRHSVQGEDATLCQRGLQAGVGLDNGQKQSAYASLHRKQLAWSNDESEKLRQMVQSRLLGKDDYTCLTLSDWRRIAKDMDMGKSGSSLKAHYRNMVDPRYMKANAIPEGLKHRGGVLKLMLTKAMLKLGGEATMPEIIGFCKVDEEIQQEFGSQLIYHKTKVNGTTRELPLWEATAATNSSNMFRKTGERRQKHVVWTLR